MADGQPQHSEKYRELASFLDGLARLGGAVSAIEALVATPRETIFRHAAGYRVGGERLPMGARFDAASLTKPWMATLALTLSARGQLGLETRLGEIFPSAGERNRDRSLEDLLRHRAGIAAWAPLAVRLGRRLADRAALTDFLLSASLWAQCDESSIHSATYSDLGYLLWGLAAERATGWSLADLLDVQIAEPLGLPPIGALAAAPPQEQVAECRLDNGREVELAAEQGVALTRQTPFLRGRSQDGNARALGFLTGHAGLFLTVDELLILAREWLAPGRLLTREGVVRALAGGGPYALGWTRQSADGSSGGALSPAAFGLTGFTGGSLWIEPERERIYVLLSHRLASRLDFNPVRREFHRLAASI